MTKMTTAMMFALLAGMATTNIYSMTKQSEEENAKQAWAEHDLYFQRQDYIKSTISKIDETIRNHRYDEITKGVTVLLKNLKDFGYVTTDSHLVNFLNEAIYSNDLKSVKIIVGLGADPASNAGPQGKFNPLWHAESNVKARPKIGAKAARDIYNYLLSVSKESSENESMPKLETMSMQD